MLNFQVLSGSCEDIFIYAGELFAEVTEVIRNLPKLLGTYVLMFFRYSMRVFVRNPHGVLFFYFFLNFFCVAPAHVTEQNKPSEPANQTKQHTNAINQKQILKRKQATQTYQSTKPTKRWFPTCASVSDVCVAPAQAQNVGVRRVVAPQTSVSDVCVGPPTMDRLLRARIGAARLSLAVRVGEKTRCVISKTQVAAVKALAHRDPGTFYSGKQTNSSSSSSK